MLVVADADLYRRLKLLAADRVVGCGAQDFGVQGCDAQGCDARGSGPQACGTQAYAPGWLAALGTLGQPDADQPDTIIGPVSAMSGMAPATVTALAELTPQTRLILLFDAQSAPIAQLAQTANPACQLWPSDVPDDTLLPLVHPPTPASAPAPGSTPAPGPGSAPRSAPESRSEADQGVQTPAAPVSPEAAVSPAAPEPAVNPPSAVSHQPSPASPLGDTDLVDAVTAGNRQLAPLALRLIEEQSGLTNARLVLNPPADGTPALPVTGFGYLTADGVQSPEQLAVWQSWLAKWLTLDKQMHTMTTLAMRDELTGVWNRRYFNRFLKRILQRATDQRMQVTVLVFDIDDFKTYNDKYGHAAGDEILTETARLMTTVVREHDVVARIGGDEFAVIFWETHHAPPKTNGRKENSRHPEDVMSAANRFQKAICQHRFKKLAEEAPGTLTISGGIATFPWDGRTPDELVEVADQMAYKSKQQGKNAITFGPGVHQANRDCH